MASSLLKSCFTVVLLIGLAVGNVTNAADNSSQPYYLLLDKSKSKLNVILAELDEIETVYKNVLSFEVEDQAYIANHKISPDRKRVVVAIFSERVTRDKTITTVAQLIYVDFFTMRHEIIAEYPIPTTWPNNFLGSWSPNNQYFSYVVPEYLGDQPELWIFDTASLSIEQQHVPESKFGVGKDIYEVGWLGNQRLVFARLTCPVVKEEDCLREFHLIDAITNKVIQTTSSTTIYGSVCQMTASPDGKFMAFIAACDSTSLKFSELFVWNLSLNRIDRLTFNTSTENSTLYVVNYDFSWLDNSNLIVSIVKSQTSDLPRLPLLRSFLTQVTVLVSVTNLTSLPLVAYTMNELKSNSDGQFTAYSTSQAYVDGDGLLSSKFNTLRIMRFRNLKPYHILQYSVDAEDLLWNEHDNILYFSIMNYMELKAIARIDVNSRILLRRNINTGRYFTYYRYTDSGKYAAGWVFANIR